VIVLDEQLLGRQIDRDIRKWYRGEVTFYIHLDPTLRRVPLASE
jgi:hypothetical protein